MIDKPPQITSENGNKKSKEIGEKEIAKLRGILKGELPTVDVENTHMDEVLTPEAKEKEKEKQKNNDELPKKGGTWHDKYDNY